MENNLASYFDHTILKFDTSKEDVELICKEAIKYSLKAVCIPPHWVQLAVQLLSKSEVKVATVVGFPMGYQKTLVKSLETKIALQEGCDEIDMVANIAALKSQDFETVEQDILALNEICHDQSKVLKVIIESSELTDEEIILLCKICNHINVDFVKTSTGYNGGGAQLEDVILMRSQLKPKISLKASGGIKTKAQMNAMINAGANRIGASASVKIMEE